MIFFSVSIVDVLSFLHLICVIISLSVSQILFNKMNHIEKTCRASRAQPLEAIPWPEMRASHQLQKAGSISCVDELLWKAFCNFPVPWKYEQIKLPIS